jgi:hypothetical protein
VVAIKRGELAVTHGHAASFAHGKFAARAARIHEQRCGDNGQGAKYALVDFLVY